MKLIIANWKANKNLATAKVWLTEFRKNVKQSKTKQADKEVVLAPSFNLLEMVGAELNEELAGVKLGVQDISSYPAGSYTGEVGIHNLEGLTVKYALVGHSERRRYQRETDLDVSNKIERCLEAGITPIVCVDEPYLASQARAIEDQSLNKCIVAYEPLSAIGTGDEMSPKKVVAVVGQIKKHFGKEARVIYGGSVESQNLADYLKICDGVLVGGASLEVNEFVSLLN